MTIRFNWGTAIAAVYTTFAVATSGFVYFAMNQPVQLVNTDYYAASLRHDERMAATRNATALGDALAIDVADSGRQVTVTWPDAQRATLTGTATLYRPSDAAADRRLPIQADASGRQILSLAGLAPGHWTVQLDWEAAGRKYYVERQVVAR